MLNLASILENSAIRYPTKNAFIFNDQFYTYHEMNGLANKVANGLMAMGIRPGEKVALSCENIPLFPAIYFGILKSGAVVVPLNVLLKHEEIAFQLKNSDSKVYFCSTGAADTLSSVEGYKAYQESPGCAHFIYISSAGSVTSKIDGIISFEEFGEGHNTSFETIETQASDTAVIVYTSGTTGKPKGAELSHENLLASAIVTIGQIGFTDQDIGLLVLPLFHIFGMSVCMNTAVYLGMTTILVHRFQPEEIFKSLIKNKVTIFSGVPTMYWGLFNHNADTGDIEKVRQHLRICVSGGASLPVKLLTDFECRFSTIIREGYGMSEGAGAVTFNHCEKDRKPGSVGLPLKGIDIVILDDKGNELHAGEKGELCYRGAIVMKGYYNNSEATQKIVINGWLHSGDVAIKDEDGYLYIVDRIKDMIVRGGFKVYPREIEEIMMKHEAISMVAVIGAPNEKLGEEVKAYVVLKSGCLLDKQTLIDWTKQHLASYKYPRIIEYVDRLPLNATGKILKRKLKEI